MASSCCWLPPILIVMGVSSAGMIQALETYRPLFMVVTFGFLGTAFYFTYRPHRAVAAGTDCCAPVSVAGKRRFNMMVLNKLMLWGVTVMAVVFLFFPGLVAEMFAPDSGEFTADMQLTHFTVEGMVCEP